MNSAKQRWTFISYSRQDKDFALELARELKSAGYLVWLDQLDIPAGARWDDEVERALQESEIFLIILTPASVSSENVKDEVGYAIDNGKRVLPVLLKECTVPLRLRRFQYVDFTKTEFNEGIKRAEQLLNTLIKESAPPIPANITPKTENIPLTAKTTVPSVPVQGDSPPRTLISNRTRTFALTVAVVILIVAVGVMKLLSLSSSPNNYGNELSSVQITATANSSIVQISSATSTPDPAACRLSQDMFSETGPWGDDTVEWGEWGHMNGVYRMRLQHPSGVLKRAWSETEVPENFRVVVTTLATIPGGTWGIYYFDTGQDWSAFEIDADGSATIKKYENSQSRILEQSVVPLSGQNRLKLENISGEVFAYVNDILVMQTLAEPPAADTFGIGLTITSAASAPVEVTFDDFSFSACP